MYCRSLALALPMVISFMRRACSFKVIPRVHQRLPRTITVAHLIGRRHCASRQWTRTAPRLVLSIRPTARYLSTDTANAAVLDLRPASNADTPQITTLNLQVLSEYGLAANDTDADLDDIERNYISRGGSFDILQNANPTIVGCVGLYPQTLETAQLRKMYLAPEYRGRGWGRKLLETALHRAASLGFQRVVLQTNRDFTKALDLYLSYGFRPFEPDYQLSPGSDQAFCLDLPPTNNESFLPETATNQQQQESNTSDRNREPSDLVHLTLDTAHDTEEFGALLCTLLLQEGEAAAAGSVIFLTGDLGAGKTCLARGFVRAAVQDWDQRVTSPTYLLSNVYPAVQESIDVHHMDLYRLSGEPRDLVPLNLDHVFANCVSLIEWPSRLGDRIPADRLEISMRIAGGHDDDFETEDKLRTVTLQPYGSVWEGRLQQLLDDRYVDDLLVDNDD